MPTTAASRTPCLRRPLEHDPEKWIPVFPRDKRGTRLRGDHAQASDIGQGHHVDATLGLPVLVFLIAVALLFDFLNGLHDAANSIATIVSTRVLRPQYAVIWAAFFNFIAFLVFGLHVANTLGTGIIAQIVA